MIRTILKFRRLLLAKHRTGLEHAVEISIKAGQLLTHSAQVLCNRVAHPLGWRAQTVVLGAQHLQQLTASDHQSPQLRRLCIGQGPQRRAASP